MAKNRYRTRGDGVLTLEYTSKRVAIAEVRSTIPLCYIGTRMYVDIATYPLDDVVCWIPIYCVKRADKRLGDRGRVIRLNTETVLVNNYQLRED